MKQLFGLLVGFGRNCYALSNWSFWRHWFWLVGWKSGVQPASVAYSHFGYDASLDVH